MAFIPFTRGLRVVMEYTLDGQTVVNVYHVRSADPIVSVNLEELALLFTDWWVNGFPDDFKAWFTTDIALQRVVVTDVSVADGEQFVNDLTTPVTGTGTDDSVPNNVAFVVSMRSNLTGRSRRGRNYYAGISEVYVVNNTLNGTVAIGIATGVVQLADELAANDYELGVASYTSLGAPRTTALFTPYTVFGGDTIVDSQRRRLPGHGS